MALQKSQETYRMHFVFTLDTVLVLQMLSRIESALRILL